MTGGATTLQCCPAGHITRRRTVTVASLERPRLDVEQDAADEQRVGYEEGAERLDQRVDGDYICCRSAGRTLSCGGAPLCGMHQTGHYGTALLVYAPVGALVYLVSPELALLGGGGVLLLATLPDSDLRVPFLSHRGPTHTLLFLLVVAGALGAAGWVVAGQAGLTERSTLAAFAFLVGVLGIGSHLLADVLTPMGIAPFWPVSSRNYTLRVTRASNPVANWVLLALGVFATAGAFVLVTRIG